MVNMISAIKMNVNLIRIGKYTNSDEVKMNEVSYLYFLLLLLYINSHL